MKDLIIKTIISVDDPINSAMKEATPHNGICFELYGFDILIDSDLKPWILEVNISPSLSSSSAFDKTVKTMLVCDALTIVGIKPTDHEDYVKNQKAHDETAKAKSTSESKPINSIFADTLDEDDMKLILDFEEEKLRTQNFELIFPVKETVKNYKHLFAEDRYNNHLLWKHLKRPLVDINACLS
mmetsp:Transcript_39141/g.44812  ORF Transcript_39141/g.44812 Transcript_39141/m.44812 type:complete len:184 (-) Transcript_39141:49-600(-)